MDLGIWSILGCGGFRGREADVYSLLLLCSGCRKAREAVKHFGLAPGVPHSHSK